MFTAYSMVDCTRHILSFLLALAPALSCLLHSMYPLNRALSFCHSYIKALAFRASQLSLAVVVAQYQPCLKLFCCARQNMSVAIFAHSSTASLSVTLEPHALQNSCSCCTLQSAPIPQTLTALRGTPSVDR